MKQARQAIQSFLSAKDFPGEILTGTPVVEIKGSVEALVLNHRGILGYSDQEVSVASSLGVIRISGEKLSIFRMNRERIVLHGLIRSVRMGEKPC